MKTRQQQNLAAQTAQTGALSCNSGIVSLLWFGSARVHLLCRLLKAEQAVLQAGGNVVRFVGLYHADR